MRRQPVASEALRSVGYDARRRVLEIEFEGGAVYRYFAVAPAVHAALMAAPSHGAFFGEHVRDAYEFERIDG